MQHTTIAAVDAAQKIENCDREETIVRTPQRKARYSDKTRIRLATIKAIALRDCKCSNTAEIKRRLKELGINLDLRLTSAWVAIVWELQDRIKDMRKEDPKKVLPTSLELLEAALSSSAIASWREDEEGGLFWVYTSANSKPDLVTSTYLPMYLRKLPVPV